jgi:hypothetical protein
VTRTDGSPATSTRTDTRLRAACANGGTPAERCGRASRTTATRRSRRPSGTAPKVIPRRRVRFGPAQSRRCPGPSPTRRATSGHRRRGGPRTGGRSRGPVPLVFDQTPEVGITMGKLLAGE